jgi:hypothetical protein
MGTNPKTEAAQTDCTLTLVRHSIRDIFLDIYPDSIALHLENPGSATQLR